MAGATERSKESVGAWAGTLLAAMVLAGAGNTADATPAAPTTTPSLLPPAETWTEGGLSPEVRNPGGPIRVRVVLRSQPLLEAASTRRVQTLVQPGADRGARFAAQDSPAQITEAERAAAANAEVSYERGVHSLGDESAQAAAEVGEVAAAVELNGGTVLGTEVLPAAVIARVPARGLARIEGLPSVQAVDGAPDSEPLSDVSVPATGAPSWWSAGLTGGTGPSDLLPADAAIEQEAPDPTHPAFTGLDLDNSPQEDPGDHGTHVAGVIASQDATYRGVAYGVDTLIGADNTEYALGLSDSLGNPGAEDPAEVINRSFGGTGAENYGVDSDVITALFGVSRAEPAGNTNVNGTPTVENLGRNMMSVAAFNDVNTTTGDDDVVLGISSRGPTPGGRKKPDLTAPGGSIVGPDAQWNSPPSSADYTGATGTSFSSPHVAGAMTLLEGAGMTDAMAQRAVLINSARDWSGASTGLAGWTAPQTGWRPEVGWGALDLTAALAQRGNYELGEVAGGEAAFYRATVPTGAKATLAFELRGIWPDYPELGSQPITYTQSNLDLRQYSSGGTEISPPAAFDPPNTTIDPGPDAVDPNDTVEQVRTPSAQTITYKVEAASQVDGLPAEPFAVASAAPLEELEAPVTRPVGVAASPNATVACGQEVTITTQLINDSPELESTSSAVGLELPAGVELVDGEQAQAVEGGVLDPSTTSATHQWTVRATAHGSHVLTVAGMGQGLGTDFRRTRTVAMEADCLAPETTIDAGPTGPGRDSTPSFSFSAAGGASGFDCSIDGASYAACANGFTAAELPDGPHSFAVRARDGVGNVDGSPATRQFIVDTLAPDTAIGDGPSSPTRQKRPRFALTSSGGSGFECAVDGAAFAPCSSSFLTPQLGHGSHTVSARAVDAAGNADPTPATRTFVVDRRVTGPRLRVDERRRFSGTVEVVVGAAEPATVKVSARAVSGGRTIRLSAPRVRLRGDHERIEVEASARMRDLIEAATENGDRLRMRIRARFEDDLGNVAMRKRSTVLR